jgi:hypothetical protein
MWNVIIVGEVQHDVGIHLLIHRINLSVQTQHSNNTKRNIAILHKIATKKLRRKKAIHIRHQPPPHHTAQGHKGIPSGDV